MNDGGWFRCAHWERGCNWLTADDSESGRCFADSFVREGPAPDDTEAMSELDSTLKDLRRLIFELMDLGLPIQPTTRTRTGWRSICYRARHWADR